MIPYPPPKGREYPKDHFQTREKAEEWIKWATPYLDKRDYFYAQEENGRFVVVQDVKP